MQIRNAVPEDCGAILGLIRELAHYEKAPNEVTVDPHHFLESGFGENPVWWALVVEVDPIAIAELETAANADAASTDYVAHVGYPTGIEGKRIVAFALYYVRYSTWKGQVMYLEDIIVTEKMRGRGIGKLLMDRLIEEARQKGFKRMAWQVLDWNEPAIGFYKKYGVDFDPEWVNITYQVS